MEFYPYSRVIFLKSKFGDKAYVSEVMDRFICGDFAIWCENAEQARALLPAILDAAARMNLAPNREPRLTFTEPDTVYYVDDGAIRSCSKLYIQHFAHPKVLDTVVSYMDLVCQKPFDQKSQELLDKLTQGSQEE